MIIVRSRAKEIDFSLRTIKPVVIVEFFFSNLALLFYQQKDV